jgi:hypothetical protein
MKKLKCYKCSTVCLINENGILKKKKGTIILCEICYDKIKTMLDLLDISRNNKYDLPPGFEALFK